jgi:leader peptidase (prepilin peptidase) / N-methyltransferase
MIRILGTIFAGLLGLAFGSFLNVCLSRWPQGESVVRPGSHCRNCDHSLAWWENVPLVSWLALRGRCRKCGTAISWRYPLVELAVGATWSLQVWSSGSIVWLADPFRFPETFSWPIASLAHPFRFPEAPFVEVGSLLFLWLLIALAAFDAESLWLPDKLTIPGTSLGIVWTVLANRLFYRIFNDFGPSTPPLAPGAVRRIGEAFIAAALILLIRWLYKLIRKREGIGLGDAKLMAMLAAWLGLPGALLAFGLGAVIGALTALALLPAARRNSEGWAATKLPLGTFLCIGGIISSLWGQQIIGAYLRWSGLW